MKVVLAGGWGYENLGDEAILRGYIEHFRDRDQVIVASANPKRTLRAQAHEVSVRKDGSAHGDVLLIGGGGYLNGRWVPEIYRKLWDLRRMAHGQTLLHAVEVRRMDGHLRPRMLRNIVASASVSVRDEKSIVELERVGYTSANLDVVPDAIALLVPHLDELGNLLPELRAKVALNLLDISRRADAEEAEIDAAQWDRHVVALVRALGSDAVGLVGGAGDRAYMVRTVPELPLIEPHTVPQMISVLRSVRAVVSVRMHPGLIASALGTPVVSIPYCGKVRPTLERIGVADCVVNSLDVDRTLSSFDNQPKHGRAWQRADAETTDWFDKVLQR